MIQVEQIHFWIALLTFVGSGLVAVITVVWTLGARINEAMASSKEYTDSKIKEAKQEGDAKRQRIYERMDEYKKEVTNTLVRKDVCDQMHIQSKDDMKRIDEDAKLFRHDMRNHVQAIDVKIDELRLLIMDLLKEKK